MSDNIQGGTPNTSCGSMTGNAMHFDGAGGERSLTTVPIDATASWMGSGTVGVLITAQQYEQGFEELTLITEDRRKSKHVHDETVYSVGFEIEGDLNMEKTNT